MPHDLPQYTLHIRFHKAACHFDFALGRRLVPYIAGHVLVLMKSLEQVTRPIKTYPLRPLY